VLGRVALECSVSGWDAGAVKINRAQLWIAVVCFGGLAYLLRQPHADGRPVPVILFLGTMALIGGLGYVFRDYAGVPEHPERLSLPKRPVVRWLSWTWRIAFAVQIVPWLARGLVTGYLPTNSSGWVRGIGLVGLVAMFAETLVYAGVLRPEETRGFARRHLGSW